MGTFTVEIEKFAEKVGNRANAVVGNIVIRVAQELDKRSPVGDATYWKHPAPKGYIGGHFRGNWQLGIGSMPTMVLNRIDPRGAETQNAILAEIPSERAGKIFWLANNVPYAQRIEDGWSPQAGPNYVMGGTVTMFQQIVREAVEALP